jgi:NAD(P)-dependent dehydrogenase (short-subunit alcohol dehydrogenase family)
MYIPTRELTGDGYERNLQSNHIGHFCLTACLFDLLADDARIINVSSDGHKIAFMGFPILDVNANRYYEPWYRYGVSKLANILFTNELQRRLDRKGLSMLTFSLFPGVVQTDLFRNTLGVDRWERIKAKRHNGLLDIILERIMKLTFVSVEEGASTQLYLAVAPSDQLRKFRGGYFVNQQPRELLWFAKDCKTAHQLWEISEEWTNMKFL